MTNVEGIIKARKTRANSSGSFVICHSSLIRHSSFVLRHSRSTTARISWPLALTLIALIIAAVIVLIFLRLESWPARTAAQSTAQLERLGRDIRAAFIDVAHLQPKITIKDRVYFEQTAPTAELATVVRRTEVEHEFLHSWAGSTKRIQLHGVFVVKAGFDLHKKFSVDVRENEIDVRLPPAQILGVEEQKVDVLAFENGFWNRISPDDIENELQVLPQLARQKATEAGLAAEAERTLKEQLEQKIQMKQPVRVTFTITLPPR
jgi:uncharacterized protein DUF4230